MHTLHIEIVSLSSTAAHARSAAETNLGNWKYGGSEPRHFADGFIVSADQSRFFSLGRTLPEKQTNSNKRSEVALCLFVNKQSHLFRKVSLRPPQNKCCSLELQPKRYFLQYLNCVAQLNLQLRLFEFVCFSGKVRPEASRTSKTRRAHVM